MKPTRPDTVEKKNQKGQRNACSMYLVVNEEGLEDFILKIIRICTKVVCTFTSLVQLSDIFLIFFYLFI